MIKRGNKRRAQRKRERESGVGFIIKAKKNTILIEIHTSIVVLYHLLLTHPV